MKGRIHHARAKSESSSFPGAVGTFLLREQGVRFHDLGTFQASNRHHGAPT